jgi:hypothetical protein
LSSQAGGVVYCATATWRAPATSSVVAVPDDSIASVDLAMEPRLNSITSGEFAASHLG